MNEFEIKFRNKTGLEFNIFYKNMLCYLKNLLHKNFYINNYIRREIIDETFEKFIINFDNYNSKLSSPKTYITSICLNLVRQRKFLPEFQDIITDIEDRYPMYEETEDIFILKEETLKLCDKYILEMPEKYQDIYFLRKKGLKNKDIALKLNKNLSAIKTANTKIILFLQKKLKLKDIFLNVKRY